MKRRLGVSAGRLECVQEKSRIGFLETHDVRIKHRVEIGSESLSFENPLHGSVRIADDRERLTDRFVFTGLVPPERIPELIASTDIVVHTSVWEGLARVLPQGLIAGKPVVSYDVDGAREVVIPNETGYLLSPQSVTPLADALIELASDPELRRRLGATGRERFTDQFRHQTMTRRIREVYQTLLRHREK